jgi:hypothetical protein
VPLMMTATAFRFAQYGGRHRNVLLAGFLLAAWHINELLRTSQPYSGMADIPVAYLTLAAAYAFLVASRQREVIRTHALTIASLIFAGAILTKQAALLASGIPGLWFLWRWREGGNPRALRREALLVVGVLALVAGHWYLAKEIQIMAGREQSEVGYVTSLVALPATQKVAHAWTLLWPASISPAGAVAAALSIAAVFHHIGRYVLLAIVLPAFLGWSMLVAYDARNFAVGFVPLATSIAFGADRVIALLKRVVRVSHQRRRPIVAAVTAAAIVAMIVLPAVASRRYDERRLAARATELKRRLGERDLNEFLYPLLDSTPTGTTVGTGYQLLGQLPGLEDTYRLVNCSSPGEMSEGLRRYTPEFYLWLPERCAAPLNDALTVAERRGILVRAGSHRDRVLFRIASSRALDSLVMAVGATR